MGTSTSRLPVGSSLVATASCGGVVNREFQLFSTDYLLSNAK